MFKLKSYLVIVIFLISALMFSGTAHGAIGSVSFTSGSITPPYTYNGEVLNGDCSAFRLPYTDYLEASTVDTTISGFGIDYVVVAYFMGGQLSSGTSYGKQIGSSEQTGGPIEIYNVNASPLTVTFYDTTTDTQDPNVFMNAPVIATATIDLAARFPQCTSFGGSGNLFVSNTGGIDSRINAQGGLEAVLYPSTDENGDASLNVYYVNENSYGEFLFSLTAEDLAPFVDNPPTENTQIKTEGNVTVYVLTTGEIQFNIGPDTEGKVYVTIIDALQPSNVYGYTIDPA